MQADDHAASLASLCLLLALLGGLMSLGLSFLGVHLQSTGDGSLILTIVLCFLGALLPAGGLILGRAALRQIAAKPDTSGLPVALTGSVTAVVGLLWCVTVIVLMTSKLW